MKTELTEAQREAMRRFWRDVSGPEASGFAIADIIGGIQEEEQARRNFSGIMNMFAQETISEVQDTNEEGLLNCIAAIWICGLHCGLYVARAQAETEELERL